MKKAELRSAVGSTPLEMGSASRRRTISVWPLLHADRSASLMAAAGSTPRELGSASRRRTTSVWPFAHADRSALLSSWR